MRAVEVSFIRDCAEMAARSSLTRTESRWGLYHDRSDIPDRDDVDWRYHLNLRKTADGDMEFLKRPVAPYFVPVPGLDELPSGETEPVPVAQPRLVGGQAPASEVSRVVATPPPRSRRRRASPRCWRSTSPRSPELAPFLRDADPGCVAPPSTCSPSTCPTGTRLRSSPRSATPHAEVRRVAADGIRELVEVLPDPEAVRRTWRSADPVVRGAAVYVLSSRRVGDADAVPATRSPTTTTGCASKRSARWFRSTTPTASPQPAATPTAKCASPSPTDSAHCAPAPTTVRGLIERPATRWCGPRRWRHWRSIGWDDADVHDRRAGARRVGLADPAGRGAGVGRGAVAGGRGAAAVARAVRSAPRRPQGRRTEPDPVGGSEDPAPRGAGRCARRRRRRRACLREARARELAANRVHLILLHHLVSVVTFAASLSVVECMFESCWRLRFR